MTETRAQQNVDAREQAPDPDDPRKPDSPGDLHRRSWFYVLRKTRREFGDDQCTDLAAALTYYSVLALFPAAIALVSLLGVVGQAQSSVDTVLQVLQPLVSSSTLDTIQPSLEQIARSQGAGLALVLGILGALWSASGYVSAFGRAMNRIYEIDEGRPFWKLRPVMLLVTLLAILLVAVVLVMLIVSGPLATSIGNQIGLGSQALLVWNIAKWPVIVVVVMLVVAMLYYATPNVKQPKFRWLSIGASVAIVIWVLASVAFAFYVATFGSYNRTYGSLAGVVVGLLWIWITNLALLLGAEIDSELERGRQLQAGMPAEKDLQLPPRDTRGIRKAQKKEAKDIERGRLIRERAADGSNDPVENDQDETVIDATDGRHRDTTTTTTTKEKTS
ncbi:YihY/virulence factor BrkB family protein [Nocardioides cynanchi]|uniref:YihY/virulence factor BrkB family protein n=1 Tax=Nocardioides cynanchi TaxID=2558918 RepID=UPI001244BD06|nr:YihY/virulence factor BrkB family protein [Nocardioides cynanchi]